MQEYIEFESGRNKKDVVRKGVLGLAILIVSEIDLKQKVLLRQRGSLWDVKQFSWTGWHVVIKFIH